MQTPPEEHLHDAALPLGSAVEVWSSFADHWCAGFTVHATERDGYRLRRASDGAVLPVAIAPDRLRPRRTAAR